MDIRDREARLRGDQRLALGFRLLGVPLVAFVTCASSDEDDDQAKPGIQPAACLTEEGVNPDTVNIGHVDDGDSHLFWTPADGEAKAGA